MATEASRPAGIACPTASGDRPAAQARRTVESVDLAASSGCVLLVAASMAGGATTSEFVTAGRRWPAGWGS